MPVYRRHGDSRLHDWLALIAGLAVILGAISPPFDDAADRSFSAHMLQHMVLIDVGAPLLAIAWPLLFERRRSSRFVAGLNTLARPVPALALSTGVLWLWHIPSVYDFALDHDAAHALEHLIFIGAFALFWRPLMDDPLAESRLKTNESRVFYLTVGMLATGSLAAWITFAGRLLYPYYMGASSGGRSALADQHLGGAIMWLIGTAAVAIAALVTMKDEP